MCLPTLQDLSQSTGWDSQPLPDLWVGLPDLRVGLRTPLRPLGGLPTSSRSPSGPVGTLGGPPDCSRTSKWSSRPLRDLQVGFSTPPGPPGGTPDLSRPLGGTPGPLYGLPILPRPLGGLPTSSRSPSGPAGTLGGPHDRSRTSKWSSRPLPDLQVGLSTLPDHQEGLSTPPGPPGGPLTPTTPTSRPLDLSRTSECASRPLTDLRVGLSTPSELPSWFPDPSQTSGWASMTFGWASRLLSDLLVGLSIPL